MLVYQRVYEGCQWYSIATRWFDAKNICGGAPAPASCLTGSSNMFFRCKMILFAIQHRRFAFHQNQEYVWLLVFQSWIDIYIYIYIYCTYITCCPVWMLIIVHVDKRLSFGGFGKMNVLEWMFTYSSWIYVHERFFTSMYLASKVV